MKSTSFSPSGQTRIALAGTFAAGALALFSGFLAAQAPPPPHPPTPMAPLSSAVVPGPSATSLAKFVKNKEKAIQLGKALFWEMQLGGDGTTACASCHFAAGVDAPRVKNQISPGLLKPDTDFDPALGGAPNHTLTAGDFPFTKFADENAPRQNTTVVSDINDVEGPQGVFLRAFRDVSPLSAEDICTNNDLDPVFHAASPGGQVNTRRVEPRNVPTTINAIFFFRNFWDGRANNDFNGIDPFGERNGSAKVFKNFATTGLKQVKIKLQQSSLASQADGPPNSPFEMSCAGRKNALIGKKLLRSTTIPLAKQVVAPTDSRLGAMSNFPANGIDTKYKELVKAAFKNVWWNSPAQIGIGPNAFQRTGFTFSEEHNSDLIATPIRRSDAVFADSGGVFTQMEANWGLFFGIAVMLYEQTLISGQTPVDKMLEGDTTAVDALALPAPGFPTGKTTRAKILLGEQVFNNEGKCILCHGGPELTNASVKNVTNQRLERMIVGDGGCAIYDNGFYNIGVRPTGDDIGLGGTDPNGDPLSETRMAMSGNPKFFDPKLQPPLGSIPLCDNRANVDGAFKAPGLRNQLLQGPYFHNGGKATLRQVVDFYNRGGDFSSENRRNMDPDVTSLELTEAQKVALVDFVAFGLLDPRVEYEKAPFDHPSIDVVNGHVNNSDNGDGEAVDQTLHIDEVGAEGRLTPLDPFLGLHPQVQ